MDFNPSYDPFSEVPPSSSYTPPVYESTFGIENPPDSEGLSHELTSEELEDQERTKQRDLENRERQKRLMAKDDKESAQKAKKRDEAREALKKWNEDRNKLILRTQEMNLTKEKELMNSKASFNDNSSWKKVASMIDFKDSEKKELARMKAVLLAKKHESK